VAEVRYYWFTADGNATCEFFFNLRWNPIAIALGVSL
jgi:hypothetical protein